VFVISGKKDTRCFHCNGTVPNAIARWFWVNLYDSYVAGYP
jgi:hypothetical protein